MRVRETLKTIAIGAVLLTAVGTVGGEDEGDSSAIWKAGGALR
jgi:hypothetical protein